MIVQPASLGPRSRPRRALRAVALIVPVVLLGGVVVAGVLGPAPAPPRPPEATPPAAAVAASPTPPPSTGPAPARPAPPAFPATVAGLQVHGVHWTVVARNRGLARGVIAVGGYLGLPSIPDECRDARLGILGPFCERDGVLTESPWLAATLTGPDAPGFHLHPQFPVGVRVPAQASFVALSPTTETPPVVILGRFSDARARPCVPGGRHCGQEFVVERVAWVDGTDYPTTPTVDPAADRPDLGGAELRADAARAASALPSGAVPLFAALVAPATVRAIDPLVEAALANGARPLDRNHPVWLFRALQTPGDPTRIAWSVVSTDDRVLASGSLDAGRPFPGG